ncbi:glycosyltransferase [Exiguobacterium sp. s55]|uniref:glycosyltransferase n=1 Tax=Exiguobacterium sp. s55 TaxID=2751245 RepID=UPI001BE6B578|nr:glycosyltransferase [Exiguobacterium sp. s55]
MEKKIIQIIPNLHLAGAEIMLENLTLRLDKEGYTVKVVSFYNEQTAISARLEFNGIDVLYLDKKRGFDFKSIIQLRNIIKEENPNIIHTHLYILPYVIIASLFQKNITKVHTIHNLADKEVSSSQRKINKIIYKMFKVIPVAISPKIKKSITNVYKFKDEFVPMVFNGVDIKKFQHIKKEKDIKEVVQLLHIGRFSDQKNHKGLIEAFYKSNPIENKIILNLIGEGSLKREIIQMVNDLNLNNHVNFLGLKSDVKKYLHSADIFILPSKWEGMPITLIEAMASGLPIIATDVGGVADMIEDNKSGLLVDLQTENIASKILFLVRNKSLRKELGEEAKNRSSMFSDIEMTKKYIDIYEKS